MIPQRIQLSGFLSYKDEQEVRFDGSPLWMLAGTNGSGKSSIFDAVTYALFGHHRGGSQNAAELINKECHALNVEFDFRLEGHLFRIRRTLKRSARGAISGTQQISRSLGGNDWEAVPDTSKRVDFDKWIHERVGLNYETFTSSVLLLQGRAEKLLDARPSGRAEVLAGIVDLERYQRLHEKANARKLELKSRLEAVAHQAEGFAEVSEEIYKAALAKIEACDQARKISLAGIDTALATEREASLWLETMSRLQATQAKLAAAESLLGDSTRIETRFHRLKELREVLPAAHTVITMRGQFKESERKTERILEERTIAEERKQNAQHDLDQARSKRRGIDEPLDKDEKQLAQVTAQLRDLNATMEKVRLIEQQEAELRTVEEDLAKIPADLDVKVRTAQQEYEHLASLKLALPVLERFQTERHELLSALREEQTGTQELERIKTEAEGLKQEMASLAPSLEEAKQAHRLAEQQVTITQTHLEQAKAALAELVAQAGQPTCHSCGQPLTPAHFAEERKRRDQAVQQATSAHEQARREREAAAEHEHSLVAKETELAGGVESRREQYRSLKQDVTHKQQASKRLTESLKIRYAELPDRFRLAIAAELPTDWTQTHYPERDELVTLRREVETFEIVQARTEALKRQANHADLLRERHRFINRTIAPLREQLPDRDPVKLREQHQELQAQEQSLSNSIKAFKKNVIKYQQEIDRLSEEFHTATTLLATLVGKLQMEVLTRKNCIENANRALLLLPETWRLAVEGAGLTEHSRWTSERDLLEQEQAEGQYVQLEQARLGRDSILQEMAELEERANRFPSEVRLSVEQARELVKAARDQHDACETQYWNAVQTKNRYDEIREQRAKLDGQIRTIDAAHNRYKIIADLLGRDRLQRHLVRRAERQIVDYANSVLDRLSGGQLFLRLASQDDSSGTDRALDLECLNRITGGAPINVAFLSGSQRFRVAVSLALGIGQYASRQHRPIESVIIDEGFGCLDRQGRQVMIQELQNLRGHLHCILLVSHQEEFADAFADGYRFELKNGSTQISRFQR